MDPIRMSGRLSGAPAPLSPMRCYDPLSCPGSPAASPPRRSTVDHTAGDRFIADREQHVLETHRLSLQQPPTPQRFSAQRCATPPSREVTLDALSPRASRASVGDAYSAVLSRSLFGEDGGGGGVGGSACSTPTRMSHASVPESERYSQSAGVVYAENKARNFRSRTFRVIPQTPERILDAPDLLDDYYLNLMDWSSTNVLAVALGQALYLWNAESGDIEQLMSTEEEENIITGVAWGGDGSVVAVGTNQCETQIWDVAASRMVQSFSDHSDRVGALAWNGPLLVTGSRDSTLRLYDTASNDCVSVFRGHSQEVCGLKWNPAGTMLASGGNDNLLIVWAFNRATYECRPLYHLRDHTAAVKAIAWNPVFTDILASGGGTADKKLRFWNVETGECLASIDTKSQVCGVLWNGAGTELVTSHGYVDNQLTIWKYPSLRRVIDLTGHTSRVLHLAIAPDRQTVVSAAGDETIRFWRCFDDAPPPDLLTSPGKRLSHRQASQPPLSPMNVHLRKKPKMEMDALDLDDLR